MLQFQMVQQYLFTAYAMGPQVRVQAAVVPQKLLLTCLTFDTVNRHRSQNEPYLGTSKARTVSVLFAQCLDGLHVPGQ